MLFLISTVKLYLVVLLPSRFTTQQVRHLLYQFVIWHKQGRHLHVSIIIVVFIYVLLTLGFWDVFSWSSKFSIVENWCNKVQQGTLLLELSANTANKKYKSLPHLPSSFEKEGDWIMQNKLAVKSCLLFPGEVRSSATDRR